MNLNEQNSSASDEVAAAEAELRAAQETLKAARARRLMSSATGSPSRLSAWPPSSWTRTRPR